MTTPTIEAAARALFDHEDPTAWNRMESFYYGKDLELERGYLRERARAVLAAVEPLIRATALEEAAKVAEDEDGEYSWAGEHRNMALLQQHSREIAAAIRALAGRPADPT